MQKVTLRSNVSAEFVRFFGSLPPSLCSVLERTLVSQFASHLFFDEKNTQVDARGHKHSLCDKSPL